MTEPTLNARIAAAKNMEVACFSEGAEMGVTMSDDGSPGRFFDWQHSIADAWELRDELVGYEPSIRRFGNLERASIYFRDGDPLVEHFYALTAPEALCLAYLAIHEDNADD